MAVLSSREIPEVPYRKITEIEKETIRTYFRESPRRNSDEFWQQTSSEGKKVLDLIKKGGFAVGIASGFGNSMDGYGVKANVYPTGYKVSGARRINDKVNTIGSVKLWETWGFISNPVKVIYENPDLIDQSLALREYLVDSKISFMDAINLEELKRNVSELELQILKEKEILRRLDGIALRRG